MIYETAHDLFAALCEPFPSEAIEWRVGSTNKDKTKCLPLCYIDARTAMDRLDGVCGPDGWQNNYTSGVNGSIVCNIGIRMPDGSWVWKADGAGATDVEGEKGALSDAFKRAAVRHGVGRYLYDIKAAWVEIEAYGKSWRITDTARKRLVAFYEDYGANAGIGSRAGSQVYRLLVKAIKEFVTDPASAQEFKDKNKAEIALLPVAMRKNLFEGLDRIGATAAEAA
jgi:hypothetical protein